LVDLQRLQEMPGASTQLLLLQAAQQGLAIYEEGFLLSSSSSSSSSSSLFKEELRAAAQQLLRQLRFFEPNPGRLLVSISSRGWQAMLTQHCTPQQQQQQQQQQPRRRRRQSQLLEQASASSSSSSSSSSSEFLLPEFELTLQRAAAEGLVRPVAAVTIPISADALASSSSPASSAAAAAAADTDPWLALCSQRSSSSSSSLVAAAYNAFSKGGKALAYTASEMHARQLSVSLNLQGISSLTLHSKQTLNDQAAVLNSFRDGPDRVLVSSLAGEAAATANLGCEFSCLLMVGAESDAAAYAARVAPVLLPAAAVEAGSSSSSSAGQCVVVDFVDASQPSPAAAVAAATTAKSVTSSDVLGPFCQQLPLPAELAALLGGSSAAAAAAAATTTAAAAASSSSSSSSSSKVSYDPPPSSSSITAIRGDLIWTILDNGSWAIPLKRGRGSSMTGLLVVWLSKQGSGWVPQLEEGLAQLSPLPGTSGKPLRSLQRARVSVLRKLLRHQDCCFICLKHHKHSTSSSLNLATCCCSCWLRHAPQAWVRAKPAKQRLHSASGTLTKSACAVVISAAAVIG
jgi:hypothetical protein